MPALADMSSDASPIPLSPPTASPPALTAGDTFNLTAAPLVSVTENRFQSPTARSGPVEVHVGAYQSRTRRLPDEPLARKRAGLWHHEERNNAIAAIAVALVRGDLESLWPFGLFLGRQYTPFNIPFLLPGWLAIVVEVLEHARELGKLLPDEPLANKLLDPFFDLLLVEFG